MSQVIVTTGDLKRDYEILGPVYFQINNRPVNLSGKNKLATMEEKYKKLASKNTEERSSIMNTLFWGAVGEFGPADHKFKTAFYIAVEELKKQAEEIGGDAVIAMRQDIDLDTHGMQYFYLQMYGTVVKYK